MKTFKILFISLLAVLTFVACNELEQMGIFDLDETYLPEARTDGPIAPSGMIASYDDYCDMVLIAWEPTIRSTSYDLYRQGILIAEDLIDTSFVDLDAITADTEYWLYAKNEKGASIDSSSAIGRMGDIPPDPVSFSATDGEYEAKVDLTWEAVDFAKYYKVMRGSTVLNDSVVGLSYSDNVDAPTEETEYSLIAVSVCGESSAVTNTGYSDPLLAFKIALDENFEGFTLGPLTSVESFGGFVPRFQFVNAPNNNGTVEIKGDNSKYFDLDVFNDKASIQLYFPEVTLLVGESYRITFDVKAPQNISLHMGIDQTGDGFMGKYIDDYFLPTVENSKNGNAFGVVLGGTGEWKSYSYDFPQTGTESQDPDPDPAALGWTLGTIQEGQEHPLIAFQMWSKNGTYAVDNIKIELIN